MPTYAMLMRWTDQGRRDVTTLPDRVEQVSRRFEELGGRLIGMYATLGHYDQLAVAEAPDDETVAKLAVMMAGRGNVVSETMRCFSMDEVRDLL